MDTTLLVGFGLSLLGLTVAIYVALVLLSPQPIVARSSEKSYQSASKGSLPLPTLQGPAEVDLSIIIPAYNEVPRLPNMLATTLLHLNATSTKRSYEIIIVNDGSEDDTSSLALELATQNKSSDIRIVTLHQNVGKGGAVRHGMLHGRGRRLLMVDADGASRFEDLELLWIEMEKLSVENSAAIVIGSRAHLVKTEAVVKRSLARNIAMYSLHTVLRMVGVGHIRDTQCGFKLYTREAAQSIFPYQHLSGWMFDVELLLMAKELHIPVAEVAISWNEVPESKLKLVRDSIRMFRDLMILRANHMFGRWRTPSKLKAE